MQLINLFHTALIRKSGRKKNDNKSEHKSIYGYSLETYMS